jgi:hypothetical protein
MADQSDVDIDALAEFGKNVLSQTLKDYASGSSAGLSKISGAVPGMIGTNEAQVFMDWNSSMIEALGLFMKDSPAGFESLGYGAIVEAANYRTGDLSQAQAMDDVIDVFNPAAGTPSVASEQADALAQAKARNAHLPPDDRTLPNQLPPPEKSVPVVPNSCVQSPEEQVRLHDKLYGKDEKWRPIDPNAPVVDDGSSMPLGPGQI